MYIFKKLERFLKMTESEEKFVSLVKGSIIQAKEVYKMKISVDNIEHIADRIFTNIKLHLEGLETEDNK